MSKESHNAGFSERLTVKALLALSGQLEQKPISPNNGKVERLIRAGELTLLLGLATIGGARLYQIISLPQTPDRSSVQTRPIETNSDIIADNFGRMRVIDGILFYQPSSQMILSLNSQTIREWLTQNGKPGKTLVFNFTDPAATNQTVQGADNWWVDLGSGWASISGATQQELYNNMSDYLSGVLATTLEFVIKTSATQTVQMFINNSSLAEFNTRLAWYQQQFKTGHLPRLIQVVSVNPVWLSQKLEQQKG